MHYPGPYYLLNFNFNNSVRVGGWVRGWGAGTRTTTYFGIISRKREGLSLDL